MAYNRPIILPRAHDLRRRSDFRARPRSWRSFVMKGVPHDRRPPIGSLWLPRRGMPGVPRRSYPWPGKSRPGERRRTGAALDLWSASPGRPDRLERLVETSFPDEDHGPRVAQRRVASLDLDRMVDQPQRFLRPRGFEKGERPGKVVQDPYIVGVVGKDFPERRNRLFRPAVLDSHAQPGVPSARNRAVLVTTVSIQLRICCLSDSAAAGSHRQPVRLGQPVRDAGRPGLTQDLHRRRGATRGRVEAR